MIVQYVVFIRNVLFIQKKELSAVILCYNSAVSRPPLTHESRSSHSHAASAWLARLKINFFQRKNRIGKLIFRSGFFAKDDSIIIQCLFQFIHKPFFLLCLGLRGSTLRL